MKDKTCAIIASSPMKFPWGYDEEDERSRLLKLMIRQEIVTYVQNGIKRFAVAVDSGYGLYTAEIIKEMREHEPVPEIKSELDFEADPEIEYNMETKFESDCREIELYCYLPYEEQATKWTPDLRERYFSALENCTEIYYVDSHYTESCYQKSKLAAIESAAHALVILSRKHNDSSLAFLEKYMEQMGMDVNRLYSKDDFCL